MILLGLGANIPSAVGEPATTLRAALEQLSERAVEIVRVSPFYRTPAWPDPANPPFVNAVAQVRTAIPPNSLLEIVHDIERHFGRVRGERNAPRTLDLDILDYDSRVELGEPELPHPRMVERAFVLVPLIDVAPDWRHPVTGASAKELLAALSDRAAIRPL